MTSEVTEDPEVGVEAFEIEVASKTDVGQVRSANEDSCDVFERPDGSRLLLVADGMGGHQGGATASRTAVDLISQSFMDNSSNQLEEMIRTAIQEANGQIFDLAQNDPGLEGMGTTVVAFLLNSQGRGTVAHVGDSRAYRYRQGQLEPITVDHSVVAEMHRRGLISAEEAAVHPRRNEILRSVGVLADVDVEVAEIEALAGDRFILCSDGLTGVVSDDEIAAVVQSETAGAAVEKLVEMANAGGGPDNISVQILAIPADQHEGDPEATAPVELSEIGIQAIETKRRNRKRARAFAIALIAAGVCLALYFAWLTFRPSMTAQTLPEFETGATGDPSERLRPATLDDALQPDSQPSRRGIPR